MDQLRRLCNVGTFSILQAKLENWRRDYSVCFVLSYSVKMFYLK